MSKKSWTYFTTGTLNLDAAVDWDSLPPVAFKQQCMLMLNDLYSGAYYVQIENKKTLVSAIQFQMLTDFSKFLGKEISFHVRMKPVGNVILDKIDKIDALKKEEITF